MSAIKGEHGTVACYAANIEIEYVKQIRAISDTLFAERFNTAIMSDAHITAVYQSPRRESIAETSQKQH